MKCTAQTKDCHLIVRIKISREEVIDEKELDRFARIFLRGFLRPKIVKKNQIEYTGPKGVTLYERLKEPVSKKDFLYILEQLVVAVQKIHSSDMRLNCLMMDIQNIYINKVTKELQFIYIPTTVSIKNSNLIDLIEAIIQLTKPSEDIGADCILRFTNHFRSLRPFNINKIEEFIAREDSSVVNAIRMQNAGQSGYMTNKLQHFYEKKEMLAVEEKEKPYEDATGLLTDSDATGLLTDSDATGLLIDEDATGLLMNDNDEIGLLDREEVTGLLVEDGEDAKTGLLNERSHVHFPTLLRVLTQETISVNKPVYRLGKEKSYVDYFVTNNIAVSRGHADIITRGNKYFVVDLNSKNHTYINNQIVPVQCEVEICDGDRLKLANEEFIFNI